ncbi:MAG TPA: hypothetical protein VN240_06230, partial [Propylenella sp.]|nr:hypothetical protein [Propylenella sp.]
MEARRRADGGAADLDRRLAELSTALISVGESSDLSRLDMRFSDIASRLDQDRRSTGETLARLEKRLSALAAAVQTEEGEAAAALLAGMTQKIDALATAIDAQDAPGARRDVEALNSKLDQLASSVAEQAEHLSRQQIETLEARLDRMQSQLEAISRAQASGASFGPFAQKLQDIAERISSLDLGGNVDTSPITVRLTAIENHLATMKAVDPRALHNQLDSIVSRLEVLKGRSIDPARLNELLDRAESVMNLGFAEERFDRLEQKLEGGAPAGLAEERFARLEQKLDDFGAAIGVGPEVLTQEDLSDLRNDIVALRRELRSLPGLGDGQASLSDVLTAIASRLERLPDDPPASAAELEAQIDRIAQLLEDPTHSRLALAHIEASLQAISERLDETRRSMSYRAADDLSGAEGVADLARALSDDVSGLKSFAQTSERKTKDALDAVQGTLEAVVKRMAFLEREADQASRSVAPGAPVQAAGTEPAPAPAIAAGEPAPETGSASLFRRLTSTQLLRRATGGRADSFSPEADADDLPLEPGTNEPLSSALAGAPSSDTALMSGERTRGRAATAARRVDTEPERVRRAASEAGLGDDFLAAARRAAQAAAAEVAQAERDAQDTHQTSGIGRLVDLFKGRRRIVLASALAVAVAFAAVQIIRGIVDSGDIQVAAVPAAQTMHQPMAPVTRVTENQAAVENTTGTTSAPRESGGQLSVAPADLVSQTPAADTSPTEPAAAPSTSAVPEASVGPTPTELAAAVPTVSDEVATEAANTRVLPPLPAAIGPDRLRTAAMAGDAVAAFEVAARYAEGRGVGQDIGAAIAWYEYA